VVAVESLPKASATLSEMWERSKVKLILVAHGRLISPPPGWTLSKRKIPHGAVGGVTDVVGQIGIYFRNECVDVNAALGSFSDGSRPRRDLWSVFKMAVPGQRCGKPQDAIQATAKAGQKVVQVRPGVVLNIGLLGVKTNGGLLRLPRIKTLFGGDMWVIRTLTPVEVLSCWGLPEKLGHLAKTDEGKRKIMKGMFTPIKIWQAVLENLAPIMSELLSLHKKDDNVQTTSEPMKGEARRGPWLNIMSAEEEREIILDGTDPPNNDFIENSKFTQADQTKRSNIRESKEPAIATKDDKAPVESETWDRMLYLGLHPKIQVRGWARASRTIRPILARHWR
jgi:hypothetical protein